MRPISLQPFVPSGQRFEEAKLFFGDLGFKKPWESAGFAGFDWGGCKFILQQFHDDHFAQNFMITIRIDNVRGFWEYVQKNRLAEKYGIGVGEPTEMPYGLEVNIIDMAGVCWHFIE